jgi:sec-independent protein translocase protein TatA
MLTNMKGWEWLIIVALILLLFGAKRLPDAARGLGRSMRIFKAETKGLAGGETAAAVTDSAQEQASAQATPAADTKTTAAPGEKPADA